MSQALLLIDVQNDYFPEGKFPLWNTTETLHNIQNAIELAKKKNIPIIHIQHIADPAMGLAPFFNKDTSGADIHSSILESAPNAPIVIKSFADGFVNTNLEATLNLLGTTELFIAGMMTQNCVTHTAISKSAEKYKVTVLPDCCTTVDVMIHNIALHAVSTRVALTPSTQALA
jgi:nicotinamidase-related amidase